ncbi:two-component hybrid sensor and regulator [Candidatus Vecturithrix granuli]|uniref:histidine kinase n=1 Tax=Vecturithrix granuli TaxID=1499967 RepID=A0A081C8V3_VECG1|nr:two-component hybrid sensor and regulator [Candidatus Vecturithrix granuli]
MKESVIVCIDDEEIVLRSLKRELNDALGGNYLIETAAGGEEALELFEELVAEGYEIPLVISDHIMPDIKGDEVLHRIHTTSPQTLTIMLTGQANIEAVTNAVNHANLYRYIAKPWEKTDLVLTVKEALHKYQQEKTIEEQNRILHNMNSILEQQVRERTAELETQKIELKEKNAQLHELNAGKDKFFSIISHDLRSPFTALLGHTELIAEQFDLYAPEELQEHVIQIRASAQKLYALLENLLTWSRIQRGLMPYQPETFDLHEAAIDNIELFMTRARQKTIVLSNCIQKNSLVYADYSMVSTIIRNLTSNALKFTPARGSVTLSATQNESYWEISIADTGMGIPDETFPQLLQIDRQYSGVGTEGEKGTGLGLILCKELVEQQQGRLWFKSTLGAGTTFFFTLPAAQTPTHS